jgi:PhnB protein
MCRACEATPYLIVKGAAEAIEFYQRAFGATELLRMADPKGRVGHAEIRIGDSVIMLADEYPEMGHRGPRSLGGSSVSILLYLEDLDTVFERALKAGARAQRPVQNQFYGDRSGILSECRGVWPGGPAATSPPFLGGSPTHPFAAADTTRVRSASVLECTAAHATPKRCTMRPHSVMMSEP